MTWSWSRFSSLSTPNYDFERHGFLQLNVVLPGENGHREIKSGLLSLPLI